MSDEIDDAAAAQIRAAVNSLRKLCAEIKARNGISVTVGEFTNAQFNTVVALPLDKVSFTIFKVREWKDT